MRRGRLRDVERCGLGVINHLRKIIDFFRPAKQAALVEPLHPSFFNTFFNAALWAAFSLFIAYNTTTAFARKTQGNRKIISGAPSITEEIQSHTAFFPLAFLIQPNLAIAFARKN